MEIMLVAVSRRVDWLYRRNKKNPTQRDCVLLFMDLSANQE
jgi:hypothetical protein